MSDTDEKLSRIEDKIDRQTDSLTDVKVTLGQQAIILAGQHESLKEHMRRTAALEATVEPIKKHVAMVGGALKLVGLIAALAAIVEAIVETLTFLSEHGYL